MELNETERITILMMRGWGDKTRTYDEVCYLFNDTFPGRNPIVRSTVQKTVRRFHQTGKISNRPKTGRPKTVSDENSSLNILQSFMENPYGSLRVAGMNNEMSHMSVFNILHVNGFKPFKIQLLQELNEDDYDRRLEFCETLMTKIDRNEIDVNRIVFSDESTFMLNGTVNRHNSRYWSSNNPHWMLENHTQRPQKVNVWMGLIGGQLLGPFFINGNLNGQAYLEMLRNHITPALINIFGPNLPIWFQQDGAPPHYDRHVRHFLDLTFPQRWIGRRGSVEWPARSPDLSPLDFYLWGTLKDKVFTTKPNNVEELRQRILQEANAIPAADVQNSINGFYHRLAHCQTTEGQHFEHLL